MTTLFAALLLPLLPAPQDPQQASAATNGLAVDLYRRLATSDDGNLFLSPWSISTALAMAAEGARAETAAEMRRALHYGDGPLANMHASFAALQQQLTAGAGNAPKATRDRITALREQLAKQNDAAQSAMDRADYTKGRNLGREAKKTAVELSALLATVDRYDLRAANSLWCDRTAPLLPAFLGELDRHYGTGFANIVDFRGDHDGARRQINHWIANRTEQRIVDMISQGGVSAVTRLVLANAVYFRGEWQEPFDADNTKDADFQRADGQKLVMRLMRDQWREDVPYAAFTGTGDYFDTPKQVPADGAVLAATYPDRDGFQAIELPYKGGNLAMVVLLPRAHDGLGKLEQMLTADRLTGWLGKLARRDVDTALPRFQQRGQSNLGQALQAMGMARAFVDPTTGSGAQFEGMNGAEDPMQKLYIAAVFHQAFVEVTEKGTEAAAATVLTLDPGSAAPRIEMVPFRPVFRADRPFLFLIRDCKSGAILFLGRVCAPSPAA